MKTTTTKADQACAEFDVGDYCRQVEAHLTRSTTGISSDRRTGVRDRARLGLGGDSSWHRAPGHLGQGDAPRGRPGDTRPSPGMRTGTSARSSVLAPRRGHEHAIHRGRRARASQMRCPIGSPRSAASLDRAVDGLSRIVGRLDVPGHVSPRAHGNSRRGV